MSSWQFDVLGCQSPLIWTTFLLSMGAPSFCSHCMEYNLNESPNLYFIIKLHLSQHEAISSNPVIEINYLLKHRHIHLQSTRAGCLKLLSMKFYIIPLSMLYCYMSIVGVADRIGKLSSKLWYFIWFHRYILSRRVGPLLFPILAKFSSHFPCFSLYHKALWTSLLFSIFVYSNVTVENEVITVVVVFWDIVPCKIM
jgi:hypothetical protein